MVDVIEATKKANAGADMEAFRESNLGKIFIEKAKREEIAALVKLADVDPKNDDAIRKLQFESKIPAAALKWIEQTISEGEQAKSELKMKEGQIDRGY